MKIQFIIVGWHFEAFPEFIDGLLELQNTNSEFINIFWSCHKEPSQRIKDNFQYKVFPNLGLEDGLGLRRSTGGEVEIGGGEGGELGERDAGADEILGRGLNGRRLFGK